MIKADCFQYITNWVNTEKSEQYKEFVLDFLRSFLSTVRANRKFVTHNFDSYLNFKPTDKFTSHAPYLLNKPEKHVERIPTYEEMRVRLNIDSQKFIESQGTTQSFSQSQKEEIEKRKKELTQGSKNIIKGIFPNTTSTVYQEVYKYILFYFRGLPNKHSLYFKTDHYSSGIKGVLPDPYTMNRIKSATEIKDSLKNTVKTIMFSDNFNSYR